MTSRNGHTRVAGAGERGHDHAHDAGASAHRDHAVGDPPGNEAAAQAVRDPVCGMAVSPTSKHQATYGGHDFRFCSAGCRAKFIAEPGVYSAAGERPVGESTAAKAPAVSSKYTCPMHPQIVRDAPGNCPICGMALEPMMPSLDDEENPELTDFRRRFWWTLPLSLVVSRARDVRSPVGAIVCGDEDLA